MTIDNIAFSSGYITVTRDRDVQTRYAIKDVLRALDIPAGLSYKQVAAITTLANLIVILIRTLIDKGVLDESFGDSLDLDWDLDNIISVIELMGGAYDQPDLDDV